MEAEGLRGRNVDHQFEARRLKDREVGGIFPFENPASIDANLATRIGKVSSITHQPADFDIVTLRICSGNRMARRKRSKLDTPIGEERVGDDEKSVQPLAQKGSERRIDVADGAGVEDTDLQPEGARCRFNVFHIGLGTDGVDRVDQNGNASCSRHQLMQQS